MQTASKFNSFGTYGVFYCNTHCFTNYMLSTNYILPWVSVKAGTPPGTPGTHPEHPEPHPEHPEPYPEHPEPHPEHPEPHPEHPEPYPEHPEHPEPHPEHPEPHLEHAGIRAMKQRTCFSINSRVSH